MNHCIKSQEVFAQSYKEGTWCRRFSNYHYQRWLHAYRTVMDKCRKYTPEWFADIYSKDTLDVVHYWSSERSRWETKLIFKGHGVILMKMTRDIYGVKSLCDDCYVCDRFMEWTEC